MLGNRYGILRAGDLASPEEWRRYECSAIAILTCEHDGRDRCKTRKYLKPLEDVIGAGKWERDRCLLNFPHASGANGHRKKFFEAARDEMAQQVATWFGRGADDAKLWV